MYGYGVFLIEKLYKRLSNCFQLLFCQLTNQIIPFDEMVILCMKCLNKRRMAAVSCKVTNNEKQYLIWYDNMNDYSNQLLLLDLC